MGTFSFFFFFFLFLLFFFFSGYVLFKSSLPTGLKKLLLFLFQTKHFVLLVEGEILTTLQIFFSIIVLELLNKISYFSFVCSWEVLIRKAIQIQKLFHHM